MPDRTQTLSVELTRKEIESTLGRIEESFHMEGGDPEADCVTCNVKEKLRAALSQPEHQGDEQVQRERDEWRAHDVSRDEIEKPAPQPKAGEIERLRERLLSEAGIASVLSQIVGLENDPDSADGHDLHRALTATFDAASSPPSDSQGDQERSPIDDLRPASKAHIALVAAVLQCLESGVWPETVRRFVNEEPEEAATNCEQCGGSRVVAECCGKVHETGDCCGEPIPEPCPDCNPAPTQDVHPSKQGESPDCSCAGHGLTEHWRHAPTCPFGQRAAAKLAEARRREDEAGGAPEAWEGHPPPRVQLPRHICNTPSAKAAGDDPETARREVERAEGGDEEDWAELTIARVKVGTNYFFAVKHKPENELDIEVRRYAPVPQALPAAVPSDPSVLEEENAKLLEERNHALSREIEMACRMRRAEVAVEKVEAERESARDGE